MAQKKNGNGKSGVEDPASIKTDALLEELQRRGYIATRQKPVSGKTYVVSEALARFNGKSFRFGVVSDTHLGSQYQQLTHLNTFYSYCARRKIGLVFHCGDIFAGYGVYKGQEFEVFLHGYEAQLNYGVEKYPRRKGIRTKVIAGNHDQSFVKSAGAYIVEELARRRDDIDYLGENLAFVQLENLLICLMHGDGGGAYARSYKLQKIIEQLPGGQKPHFLFLGHFHVPDHLPFYRNVEGVQMGCFEAQTPLLARKGLSPVLAGVIVTVTPDQNGVAKVEYEWVPFQIPVDNDYP